VRDVIVGLIAALLLYPWITGGREIGTTFEVR
jgi:hypothetical protein